MSLLSCWCGWYHIWHDCWHADGNCTMYNMRTLLTLHCLFSPELLHS